MNDLEQSHETIELAKRVIAAHLCSLYKTWTVKDGVVSGPGSLEVRIEDQHRVGPNHFDIGFVFSRDNVDAPVIWDCAAGAGPTIPEVVNQAVERWTTSTLPVFLELLTRDGSFADHFHAQDTGGCKGWHVIHGPLMAFGFGPGSDLLQNWTLEYPILPRIGPIAAKAFDRSSLNGVKVLFGFGEEEVVEVRVNGRYDKPATDLLRTLDWPRSPDAGFLRCFFLFVHAEE